jgi:hypothetical protein
MGRLAPEAKRGDIAGQRRDPPFGHVGDIDNQPTGMGLQGGLTYDGGPLMEAARR